MPTEFKWSKARIFNNRVDKLLEHTRGEISELTVLLDVFILMLGTFLEDVFQWIIGYYLLV